MSKGPFLYGSRNGTGPKALAQVLKEHYTNLSAAYLQKGMKREAKLFEDAVEELKRIEQEIRELSAKRSS